MLLFGLMQLSMVLLGSAVSMVPLWIDSFACGCERIFKRRGNLTRRQRFCGGQPFRPPQLMFNCLYLSQAGDLTQH